jgi:flagellar biosynthesis anti-sigma factor FlgM
MRIDNNRANFDRLDTTKAAGADAAAGKGGAKTTSASGDSVRISSGVQFASTAVAAASNAPELRQDKIERARALLADGTLGGDSLKLADALIDRAITKG